MKTTLAALSLLFGAGVFTTQAQDEGFRIGYAANYQIEAFEYPILVWLPENYDPQKKWPIAFYYHGTNGRPTVEFMRLASESKDWLLVGMSYKLRGRFNYTPENLQTEIDIFREVYSYLDSKLSIDSDKVYVGGFSKGGWMTSFFLQTVPEIAGGMVLGGGLIEIDNPKFKPEGSVFLGCGEYDRNAAPTFRAGQFFKKQGCQVLIDYWEDKGHDLADVYDPEKAMKLRQWLNLKAGIAKQVDALEWFDSQVKKVKQSESLKQGFYELINLSTMPYIQLLDSEAKGELKKLQTVYKNKPDLTEEYQAWVEFQRTLAFEARDNKVETLAESIGKYNTVGRNYPATKFGIKAVKSSERIKQSLGME